MLVIASIVTAASLLGMLYVSIIDSPTPTLVMVSQWVSTASVLLVIAVTAVIMPVIVFIKERLSK
jgi:hypothetical protein